jgi:hypothetical protein
MTDPSQHDHSQHRAIRLQSTALVLAALITTAGAVTSAFIQSGWLGKTNRSTAIASAHPATPTALASFVGTIEPLAEMPVATSGPVPPAAFSGTSRSAPALQPRIVSPPLMGVTPAWFPGSQAINAQPASSAKTSPKPVDLEAVPHLIYGR